MLGIHRLLNISTSQSDSYFFLHQEFQEWDFEHIIIILLMSSDCSASQSIIIILNSQKYSTETFNRNIQQKYSTVR